MAFKVIVKPGAEALIPPWKHLHDIRRGKFVWLSWGIKRVRAPNALLASMKMQGRVIATSRQLLTCEMSPGS